MQRSHSARLRQTGIYFGFACAVTACGGGETRDYFPDAVSGAAGIGGSTAGPSETSNGGGAPAAAGAATVGRTAPGGASGQASGAVPGQAMTGEALTGSGGTSGGAANTGTAATGAVGPPMWQSGSREVTEFTTDTNCESISFEEPFDPNDDVLAFVTAAHPGSTWTHAPLARWVEGVSAEGFTVCLREDTDYDGAHEPMRLDWLALPASNASVMGFRAGRHSAEPLNGKTCGEVAFEPAFSAVPDVQVALDFARDEATPQDPAAIWIEEVTESGFRACVEKLQGFDGALAPVSFAWLAVPTSFANTRFVRGRTEFPAFSDVHCTTVETSCADCDRVQLSAHHRGDPLGASVTHDPVLVWAEDLSGGELTICARETSGNDFTHDPHLEVSFLVERSVP